MPTSDNIERYAVVNEYNKQFHENYEILLIGFR